MFPWFGFGLSWFVALFGVFLHPGRFLGRIYNYFFFPRVWSSLDMTTSYVVNNWVAHVNKSGQRGTGRAHCRICCGNKSTSTPFDVSNHLCMKTVPEM